jgi:hypothetical protein
MVGVAGFEPTASSSRTAGTAVDSGCFRTPRAADGRCGAVLVGLVAVLRCCTATGTLLAETSYARVTWTRRGTWFRAG